MATNVIRLPTVRPLTENSIKLSSISESSIKNSSHGCRLVKKVLPQLTEEDLLQLGAVSVIEEWWICTRNRQLFRIMKDAVCSAEHSLTHDVLRKLCPREAELLRDPTMNASVKFRFGGSTFPPIVLFKVYISMRGTGVQYITGKKMIKQSTLAATDACKLMGNRKYFDHLLSDTCQQHHLKITEESDVTTIKEYMQFSSNLDETPAHLGGRQNLWRKLDLEALPRHSHLYNVMFCLGKALPSTRIPAEDLRTLSRPLTQAQQVDQIRRISTLSSTNIPISHSLSGKASRSLSGKTSRSPSRRSRQAKERARSMRKHYQISEEAIGLTEPSCLEMTESKDNEDDKLEGLEEDCSAEELYKWTKELSFDDCDLQLECHKHTLSQN